MGNDPQFVAVGNFDGNADQDLVVATDLSFNGSVLLGDGNGIIFPVKIIFWAEELIPDPSLSETLTMMAI